ncbi:class I SAM-dependent methyltransferase [Pseudarthrobacter sp. P1]|uniref:class I SAM-dependent methyltransferase n=1 Tax=Pseudarthrobacter sp. P1 TaxID=3418418 RepID=UPI003CF27294
MTQHSHRHHGGDHDHHDEAGLAELLDWDAEVLGSYLDEATGWIEQLLPSAPRTVVDVGAGTGTGTLALARRFASAQVMAIDRSPAMLDRVGTEAGREGMADRVHLLQADLDSTWPDAGAVDLAWASSSLHELADPERVFEDLFAALNPGGLLAVIEMDALPRFLPDDVGLGRPGLEVRCHEAVGQLGWNSHPDWRPQLERAGFDVVGQRIFPVAAGPAAPNTGRFAYAYLSRMRTALAGRLDAEDLATLDLLLSDGHPGALLRRADLSVHGSRTAWLARRP